LSANTAAPSIAVVVPTRRAGENLRRCLRSLAAARPAPDEILVVVDGDDPTDKQIAAACGVTPLALPHNRGPAAARNHGAHAATSDILFFVDADVELPGNTIAKIRESFRNADPDVAAIIGSYDDAPSAPGFFSRYKNLAHHFVHQHADEEGCTFWGACGAIRREVFLSLNGFSEAFTRPSVEDIELGYRLKAEGHRIRIRKDLQVKHGKRWSARSLFVTDVLHRAIPWTRLLLAYGRLDDDLNIATGERLKVVLAWLAVAAGAAGIAVPAVLGLVPALLLVLLALDRPLLGFLRARHGSWFAARAGLWHCFYHLYSGLGFGIGVFLHCVRRPAHRRLQEKAAA